MIIYIKLLRNVGIGLLGNARQSCRGTRTALGASGFREDCTEFCMESPVTKTIVTLLSVTNRFKGSNHFSGDILRYPLSPGKGAV